jgi:hypothetical protein
LPFKNKKIEITHAFLSEKKMSRRDMNSYINPDLVAHCLKYDRLSVIRLNHSRLGKIFLTCHETSLEESIYQNRRVSLVVTIEKKNHNPGILQLFRRMHCAQLHYSIEDDEKEDITGVLPDIYTQCMKRLSKGKNVLIHCAIGMSRSVSAVMYILARIETNASIRKGTLLDEPDDL